MHARQLDVLIHPGSIPEAMATFQRDVVPLLRLQAGFVGTSVLIDPDSGAAQFLTYWKSLSDLAALGESRFFEAQVAKLSALFATVPVVRVLDVGVLEGSGSGPEGADLV